MLKGANQVLLDESQTGVQIRQPGKMIVCVSSDKELSLASSFACSFSIQLNRILYLIASAYIGCYFALLYSKYLTQVAKCNIDCNYVSCFLASEHSWYSSILMFLLQFQGPCHERIAGDDFRILNCWATSGRATEIKSLLGYEQALPR